MTHSKAALLTGLTFCGVAVVLGQMAMSCWLAPGTARNSGIVEDIGYTFTGLTAAIGYMLWKWGRFKNISKQTNIYYWLTRTLQAATAMIPVFFGCVYFYIAGEYVERHARTFAALPPLMYLLVFKCQRRRVLK